MSNNKSNKKKLIIIIIIVIIIGMVLLNLFIFKSLLNNSNQSNQSIKPFVSDYIKDLNLEVFESNNQQAQKQIITSQGVVNLTPIYQNKIRDLSMNGVEFADNQHYYMAYYPREEGFMILIKSENFEQGRMLAEKKFLNLLNIDKKTACSMNVTLNPSPQHNPDHPLKNYKLSFCQ